MTQDMRGKRVVITGANSGLGFESTRALAAAGATVIMACRSAQKAQAAVDKVLAETPGADVSVRALDLANLSSIRSFADSLKADVSSIDVLLNNAGLMAIPRTLTADGFEMQLGTNHLGHFALTGQLLGLLEAAPAPRVVNVASTAHRMGKLDFDDLMGERQYGAWSAYGQSKLANLAFTYELERRLRAAGKRTIALAAHPGYASTELQGVAPRMEGSAFKGWIMDLGNSWLGQSAARGAIPQIHAATAPDVKGGEYYGPDGLLEMWGKAAKRCTPTAAALDPASHTRLWEASVSLTGVDFGGL